MEEVERRGKLDEIERIELVVVVVGDLDKTLVDWLNSVRNMVRELCG